MAHYAILNNQNIVESVIVGKDEGELSALGETIDWELYYKGKRTSYNTYAGEHRLGGEPFRKNYAGIGYTYDAQRDAFIPPKPIEEGKTFALDEVTCQWVEV